MVRLLVRLVRILAYAVACSGLRLALYKHSVRRALFAVYDREIDAQSNTVRYLFASWGHKKRDLRSLRVRIIDMFNGSEEIMK